MDKFREYNLWLEWYFEKTHKRINIIIIIRKYNKDIEWWWYNSIKINKEWKWIELYNWKYWYNKINDFW